jgi:hypothetical protein
MFEVWMKEPADITNSPTPKLDQRTKKSFPVSILSLSFIGVVPISELCFGNFMLFQTKFTFYLNVILPFKPKTSLVLYIIL